MSRNARTSPVGLMIAAAAFGLGAVIQLASFFVRLRFTQNRDAIWVHPVTALFFAMAAWAFFYVGRRIRTRRDRLARGACVRCGYDLTGNVTGICPECGTRVTLGLC